MTPFFFGTRERRLFGIYAPGRTVGAGPRAVVLCHPWGQEYLRAHRSMRHLANLLARAGVHVLRFDYFGTGDSAGDSSEGDLEGWRRDIETAVDELKDTSGAARVGLVGLRLGGALAASVAARRRGDVDSVVLWDPVVRGEEYLEELGRWSSHERITQGAGDREVLGFLLTAGLSREIGSIDLQPVVPFLPARTLVVVSGPSSHGPFQAALAERPGGPVPLEPIASPAAWLEDRNTGVGALPVKIVQRIAQWWD
jgi:exosortase A-associated hydrolase 2